LRVAHRHLHWVLGGAVEGQAVDHGTDNDAAADELADHVGHVRIVTSALGWWPIGNDRSLLPSRSKKGIFASYPQGAMFANPDRCQQFQRFAGPRRWRLKGPGGTFSIVDPAGTWAWRSGPAAAVRQGAVLALLPAEAAVQLRAEAAVELAPCAEAAELPRRAEAAAVELPRRAEVAAAELAPCAEAAAAELAPCAEAAYQRRRYPRCPVTARQEGCDCREPRREACDRRDASQCWLRGRLLRP